MHIAQWQDRGDSNAVIRTPWQELGRTTSRTRSVAGRLEALQKLIQVLYCMYTKCTVHIGPVPYRWFLEVVYNLCRVVVTLDITASLLVSRWTRLDFLEQWYLK